MRNAITPHEPQIGPPDAVELIETAITSLPDHAVAELAVDLHDTKSERDVVRAVHHRLRSMGVDTVREQGRVDLVVNGSGTEWKVMLPHQILRPDRYDGGFTDFHRKSKDLKRLQSGATDVLVAVIPTLLSSPHRQPAYRQYFKVANPELFVGEATVLAQAFANSNAVTVARRVPVMLHDDHDGDVELLVFMFVRPWT